MRSFCIISSAAVIALASSATAQTVPKAPSTAKVGVTISPEIVDGLNRARAALDLSDVDLDLAPMVASVQDMAVEPMLVFGMDDVPRAPWAASDPADSLYRLARESLNAGDYRRAAQLFEQITARYPKSQYRADAAYWRAFSLYRIGDTADLHQALKVLDSAPPVRTSWSGLKPTRIMVSDAPFVTSVNGDAISTQMRAAAMAADSAASTWQQARVSWVKALGASDQESAVLAVRIRSALAARGDAAAAAQLARTAGAGAASCDEDDAQLRVEALNALVQMDPKNAEPAVSKVLARRDACSVSLRRGAVALTGRTNNTQSADVLINVARTDPSPVVRAEAMSWLARSTDPRATSTLLNLAATDTTPALRRIATRSLASQKSPAARLALRSLMTRGDVPNGVRVTALHYAGTDDLQVSDLVRIYDSSADRDTREEVIRLLSLRSEPAATDKLISIARTSTDPAMRRLVIETLSRKKDPRTAKLLMDIISK